MTHNRFSRRNLLAALGAATAAPVILGGGFPAMSWAAEGDPVPPPLGVYGKLPTVSKVALSPDGSRVALVMNSPQGLVIYDVNLATGKSAAAAIESDKIRDLMWADNDRILVVTSVTRKDAGTIYEEWFGLMLDVHANKRVQMYSYVSGVNYAQVFGSFYRVNINGKYFATAAGYKAPEAINMSGSQGSAATFSDGLNKCLYAFDPGSSRSRRLDEDSKDIEDWVVAPDGKVVARSEYDDDTHVWTLRYKSEKGWKVIYEIKIDLDAPALCGLGRDGRSVLLYMRSGELQNSYVEVSPGGIISAPLEVNGNVNSPIFHPTTFALAGFANTEGIANYTFYDPVMAQLPKLVKKAVGDIRADLMSTSEDPLHVLIFVEGEGNSGSYYAIDFRKGGYKEIGQAYPDLPPEWVSEKKHYSYKAADGLEIPSWLTLPVDRDAKKLALVVLPHGGPESNEDSSFDFLSQALASRGYAVMQPDYRGSSGYGRDYMARGYGEYGRKMQTDLSDGVRDLVTKGIVDPTKVSIFGGSYGGYAALAGVSLDPGIYNCAVSLAGISDIKAFMAYYRERTGFDGDGYGMRYWNRYLGDENSWNDISPIKHVDAITVPILLIHGKDDTIVPYDQSTRIYDALKKAGKPVELIQLKQEDHWMSREPTRIQTIVSMVEFMLQHNPPT
jgi:dipeptidyl aminopeptidase/acylaminoacyl peptidase